MDRTLVMLAVLLAGIRAWGQETPMPVVPVQISYKEAAQHRLTPVEPIRDPNNTGFFQSIEIEMTVDAQGHVLTAKAIRGPSEWTAVAVARAQAYTYKPFERRGKAVPVKFNEYVRLLPLEKLPAVHVPFPEVHDRNSLRMTLSRSGCFGSCPAYTVEIAGDGSVSFTGKSHVLISGQHDSHISQEAVSQILEAFRKADYFSLADDYTYPVTDSPTYVTSISFDGHSKSVHDYVGEMVGMPQVVTDLESTIDRLAGTEKWIHGTSETVPSLIREPWKFKSPEAGQALERAASDGAVDAVRGLIAAGVSVEGPSGGRALASACGCCLVEMMGCSIGPHPDFAP